jgi:hypothetical protein
MVKEVFDIVRKAGGTQKEYDSKDTTPIENVLDCLQFIEFEENDIVVDAGSGKEKVWFDNIKVKNKLEFEIDEEKDFLKYNERVDWVIGNPPYKLWLDFMFHSADICNKGFCFFINHIRLNQLTPKRLNDLKEKGFYLTTFRITNVKKWFGRYYYLVFTKKPSNIISFNYTKKIKQLKGEGEK